MNPKIYRDREVLKIIDAAFEQFKITDPNEKLDIATAIKQQLDTSNPVSSYYEDVNASSSVYRANVRNALIDIIAHLLASKDAKTQLNQMESVSRSVMDQANIKLLNLQKRLIGMSNKIKESFVEGLDVGNHNNTIVKEGNLRVNFLDKQIIPTSIDTVIFPTNSHFDGVVSTLSKNENKLFKTGLGSDSFRASTYSKKQPGSYIMGSYLEGMTVQFTLKTEPFIPKAISGKASTPFRIALWEGYDSTKEKWIVLGNDETLGTYSYIDTNLSNASNGYNQLFDKIRVSVYFPDYIKKDGKYFYEGIMHNIKLFERDRLTKTERGTFLSHKYVAPEGLFKIKFDAKFKGWVCCKIISDGDVLNPYYVLPRNSHLSYDKYYNIDLADGETFSIDPTMDFKYIEYYAGQTDGAASTGIVLPLEPNQLQSGTLNIDTIKAFGSNNQTINYTISSEGTADAKKWILKPTGYTGYVFITYALQNNNDETNRNDIGYGNNEIIFKGVKNQSDLHDKLNNFIFPLSAFPFREDDGTLSSLGELEHFRQKPTFKLFNIGGEANNLEIDATEIFPVDGIIDFNNEEKQFYYFNKKLYTNFNLYDMGNDNVRVDYGISCSNIQVAIDLYDDATVDEYSLELISLDKPAFLSGLLLEEEQAESGETNNQGGGY